MHVHIYTYTRTYICVHVCAYIYIYTCIYMIQRGLKYQKSHISNSDSVLIPHRDYTHVLQRGCVFDTHVVCIMCMLYIMHHLRYSKNINFLRCTIRTKNPPYCVILTHVLCIIFEEFLIDDDMVPYLCTTYIDKEPCRLLSKTTVVLCVKYVSK